jgi:hypothetical protein
MTWRDARSIDVLKDELDAAHPNRSTASDGTIGDSAHASRNSDHNPWVILDEVGIVRARDVTHDPAHGVDCDVLAERIAALIALGGHPALRHGAYVIRNRRIFSFDRRDEGWRPYSGSNPHEKHMHVSVSLDPAGFDSTAPWGITEEEDPMADYADQLDRIEKKLDRAQKRDVSQRRLLKSVLALLTELTDLDDQDPTVAVIDDVKRRISKAKQEVLAAIAELDQDE